MTKVVTNKGTITTHGRVRYLIAFMSFIICMLLNFHRLIIGVAIVAMVKHKHFEGDLQANASTLSCPLPAELQSTTDNNLKQGDLDWSSELQGYVLGVGFLGYIITQLPGGRWAETWGAKKTLLAGNFLAAVFTFITPMATWWNVYAVIVVQFLRGLVQGVTVPAVFVLMANWFPRQERGFLSSLVMSGFPIGAATAGVVTGWLCEEPQFGWPTAFYAGGIFAAIISLLFAFVVYETPQRHPTIILEELKYITEGQECDLSLVRPPTPWRKMLTSVPVYALLFGMSGLTWSFVYFLSVHPTYMGRILHFPIRKNGAASTIPISLTSVGAIVASFLTNWITKRNYIGVDKLRKSLNFVGSLGFSVSLLGAYWAKCDSLINIICFSFSSFFNGIAVSGAMITSGDMSPRFSGTLFAIASTAASIFTFIIPVMVGNLTKHQMIEEWHTVFFISIAVVLSCGLIFIFFGSAEVQPWNDPDPQENPKSTHKQSPCENKESSVATF